MGYIGIGGIAERLSRNKKARGKTKGEPIIQNLGPESHPPVKTESDD